MDCHYVLIFRFVDLDVAMYRLRRAAAEGSGHDMLLANATGDHRLWTHKGELVTNIIHTLV